MTPSPDGGSSRNGVKKMKSKAPTGLTILMALAVAALTGCDAQSAHRSPGSVEMGLVALQLDAELNAPAQSLHQNLVRSISDKRIYPEELVVIGEGSPTPVDWWAYDKGLIRLAGVADYRGYFALTSKGEAFAKAPAPHWLTATLKPAPQVACGGGDAWASCTVSAIATVQPTKDGSGVLAGRVFADMPFTAILSYSPSGWRVSDLHAVSGPEPAEVARADVFGDPASIAKARYRFALDMNRRV